MPLYRVTKNYREELFDSIELAEENLFFKKENSTIHYGSNDSRRVLFFTNDIINISVIKIVDFDENHQIGFYHFLTNRLSGYIWQPIYKPEIISKDLLEFLEEIKEDNAL